jgi:hypothetical protein
LLDRLVHLADRPVSAVKINYEGVASTAEFLARTAGALRGHDSFGGRVRTRVRAFLDEAAVEVGPVRLAAGLKDRDAGALVSDILLRVDDALSGDECLVLALDEVPLAVRAIGQHQSQAEAVRLLHTLRGLRSAAPRLRWIVTGSVGFHHVLRELGTTTGAINDLTSLALGPLEPEWASALAEALLHGIGCDPSQELLAALVHHSGGIPYLVHQLTATIQQTEGAPTATAVASAWEAFVDDRDASRAVLHFLTRIGTEYYRDTADVAGNVLDRIAREGPVVFEALVADEMATLTRDEALLLADNLVDDHYLVEDIAGFRWRYDVLQRIWVRNRRLT